MGLIPEIPLYIKLSVLTMIGYGTSAWLEGLTTEKGPEDVPKDKIALSNATLELFYSGVGGLLVILFRRKIKGDWFAQMSSSSVGVAGLMGGVFLYLAMFTFIIAVGQDPDSKGPVSAILSFNGCLIALITFLIYREKLNFKEMGGMFLAFVGLMLITFGNGVKAGSIKGPVLGMIALCFFVGKNVALKILGKRECDALIVNALMFIPALFFGAGIVAVQYWQHGTEGILEGLHGILYFYPLCASACLWLGQLAMVEAFKHGPAGPIGAVCNSHSLLVLTLDVLILGDYPVVGKVIGMFVVIVGVAVLSMARKNVPEEDDTIEKKLLSDGTENKVEYNTYDI
eukprot:TRINITY_DN634_c0_g4_i2.p1 TRINITY_DN634_c0_g4~~TRINITY_DN634_c0_g4_i2.p1  ORF type:complete len:342 (-),score=90.22 TRINITY_DN634_c0_g4_i2:1138-2163(-)